MKQYEFHVRGGETRIRGGDSETGWVKIPKPEEMVALKKHGPSVLVVKSSNYPANVADDATTILTLVEYAPLCRIIGTPFTVRVIGWDYRQTMEALKRVFKGVYELDDLV